MTINYINFAPGGIVVSKNWTDFKAIVITSKGLTVQYEDDANAYYIFAIDNNTAYQCIIYKGTVPDPSNYSQGTNDSDKTDFTTNYLPTANAKTILNVTVSNTPTVNIGTTNGLALDVNQTNGTARSKITDGTNNAAVANSAPAGTEYGLITRNIPSGTQTVSVSGTPTVTGSGTAGTPATGVVTIQGISGGTVVPVSGTVTANIGTTNGLALDATLSTLSGKFGSIGQKAMAASAPVVIASDQSAVPVTLTNSDLFVTGAITNTQTVAVNTQGRASVGIGLTGTWTGTVVFETTIDGSTWIAAYATNPATGAIVSSATAVGNFEYACGGYQQFRIRGNTVATGSLTVSLNAATGASGISIIDPLPTGSNTIGAVTISGTPAVTISGTPAVTVTSGTVTANIGTTNGLALDATLTTLSGKFGTIGQKASAASAPVVIASDQSTLPVTVTNNDLFVTGAITNTQNVAVNSQGRSTVAIALTGTWTGTAVFEKTVDGTNWVSAYVASPGTGLVVTSATANGTFEFGSAGYQQLRVRGATVATGSLTVSLNAGTGVGDVAITSPLPVGSNVIGAVTISGTPAVTVTGTVTSNIGTTNGLALDASITSLSGKFGSLGQKAMAGSAPVVLASDQAAIPVTQSGTWTNRLTDGTNTATVKAASTPSVVGDTSLVVQISPNQVSVPVTISNTDRTASGAITTTQTVSINTQGTSTATVSITGVWTGTIVFEATVDGTNWVSAYAVTPSNGAVVTSTTGNGVFEYGSGGYLQFRVRGNSVATGSASIVMDAATGVSNINLGSPLPAGSNVIGAVTISGTPTVTANIGTTNGLALNTTLTGGTQISQIGNATNLAGISNGPAGTEYGLITRNIPYGSQNVRNTEVATFVSLAASVTVANNKSLMSIVNTGTKVVRIADIFLANVFTGAGSINGSFFIRRCTGHASGTAVLTESLDTTDSLDSGITLFTGATISGQSTNAIRKVVLVTGNLTGTLNTVAMDHAFTPFFPIFAKPGADAKPIVLRTNQGITVNFETNSPAGQYDIQLVFTQE